MVYDKVQCEDYAQSIVYIEFKSQVAITKQKTKSLNFDNSKSTLYIILLTVYVHSASGFT